TATVDHSLEMLSPLLELESEDFRDQMALQDSDLQAPTIPDLPMVGTSSAPAEFTPRPSWQDVMRGELLLEPSHAPVGGGWEGREQATRRERAFAQGGTKASGNAVKMGLAWVAAHQRKD